MGNGQQVKHSRVGLANALGCLCGVSRKDQERKWSLYRDLDSGWRK
jgi:hypothetical protein